MFDLAWTQIGLIGVVALVLIGPKDMPVAIKAMAGFVKKARRMAGEFQSHVDEMVKDTDLADLRNTISDIRSFDIKREVAKVVDADGSLRGAFSDPMVMHPGGPGLAETVAQTSLTEGGQAAEPAVSIAPRMPDGPAPAFVPPAFVPTVPAQPAEPPSAPSFIPPQAAQTEPRP